MNNHNVPEPLEPSESLELGDGHERMLADLARSHREGALAAFVLVVVDEGDFIAVNVGSSGHVLGDRAMLDRIEAMLHATIRETMAKAKLRPVARG